MLLAFVLSGYCAVTQMTAHIFSQRTLLLDLCIPSASFCTCFFCRMWNATGNFFSPNGCLVESSSFIRKMIFFVVNQVTTYLGNACQLCVIVFYWPYFLYLQKPHCSSYYSFMVGFLTLFLKLLLLNYIFFFTPLPSSRFPNSYYQIL